jgi:uncharacterized protein (UPF0332 family)
MSLHFDLLEQSKHLLNRESRRPKQASLRRAVSSAYYSLFHLLIYEACKTLVVDEDTIGMIARAYDHGKMSKISKSFAMGDLPRKLRPLKSTFSDPARKPIVDRLKSVARTFVDLQDARHEADYNLRKRFNRAEVKDLIDLVESAFSDWNLIRKDDLARIYLTCFLLFDTWDKER